MFDKFLELLTIKPLAMKTSFISFLIIAFGLSCFGQEIEFSSSLNTSSELRFQNAYGIGLQYQHNISSKFKVGLGIHYNFHNSQFDYLPYVDFDPNFIISQKINSHSHRFSYRINIQGLLLDNENASISLGPEISYNYLWGQDQIVEIMTRSLSVSEYSKYINLTKHFGAGLISIIEIKNVFSPQLSLCFTIRPEYLIGKEYLLIGGSAPVFYGGLSFTEFQIGLKYKFKK
jgi:hypothetical protein